MPSTWEILGLDGDIKAAAKALMTDGTRPVIISGPAGAGQLALVDQLASAMNVKKGRVVYFFANNFSVDVPLHPFTTGTFSFSTLSRKAREGALSTSRPIEAALGTGGVITGGLQVLNALWEASKGHRTKMSAYFSEAEIDVILNHIPIKGSDVKKVLCIANAEYLDQQSKLFIRKILDPKIRAALPRLKNVAVVLAADQQDDVENYVRYYKGIDIGVEGCPQDRFSEFVRAVGLRSDLPDIAMQRLWAASRGLLDIVSDAVALVNSNAENADDTAALYDSAIDGALQSRISAFEAAGLDIYDAMSTARSLGAAGRIVELSCVLEKTTENKAGELIKALSALSIIDIGDETFRLRRDWGPSLALGSRQLAREKISGLHQDCVRLLDPGDYFRRSALCFAGGEIDFGCALEILGRVREILSGAQELKPLSQYVSDGPFNAYSRQFEKGIREFRDARIGLACSIFEALPDTLPKLLRAERDYLWATAKVCTHEKGASEVALKSLERWNGLEEEEAEIGIRILSREIELLAFNHRLEEAKEKQAKLVEFIEEKWSFNQKFLDILHSSFRRSYMIRSVEASQLYIEQALDYFFARNASCEVLVERYKTLTNYSGNLIQNGAYAKAAQFAMKALDMIVEHDDMDFPRKDLAWNNLVLAMFRNGEIGAGRAITFQEQIIKQLCSNRDTEAHLVNLAIYLCFNSEVERAYQILSDLIVRIDVGEIGETFLVYPILLNITACHMVRGDREAARRNEDRLRDLDSINWHLTPYNRRRAALVDKAIAEAPIGDALAWENIFHVMDPTGPGKPWAHYGRGFLGCQLSFISDL